MKRSESVLVYSVTGVLAVILAVAIVFGENPAKPDENPDTARVTSIDDLDLEDAGTDPAVGGDTDGEEGSRTLIDELLGGSGLEAGDPVEPITQDEPITEIPLVRTVATLGVSRTEENPASGERYRIVQVRSGDVLGAIVQRWCPGVDQEIVAALNETIDPMRLKPGQEICLPWVDDEILLEAHEARMTRGTTDATPAVADGGQPSPAPASVGQEYTIQKNESLWVIAARKVGANKAQAYINQIVAANPKITDASRVREGMKIVLP